jgi:hypothetical protein
MTIATPTQAIVALSCTTSSFCVAVGGPSGGLPRPGYAWLYRGSSWSPADDIDASGAFVAVSCSSSTFCIGLDANSGFTIFNGVSWSAPKPLDPDGLPAAISCWSDQSCLAVGIEGNEASLATDLSAASWSFDGSTWSRPTIIGPNAFLSSVSCPSPTFCAAVGGAVGVEGNTPPAEVTIFNGSHWSVLHPVSQRFFLGPVACASRHLCFAGAATMSSLTTPGVLFDYDGTRWSSPQTVDELPFNNDAISCPSTSFCMAADVRGDELTYNGSSWTSTRPVSGVSSFVDLVCTSTSTCVGADSNSVVFWRRDA